MASADLSVNLAIHIPSSIVESFSQLLVAPWTLPSWKSLDNVHAETYDWPMQFRGPVEKG